MRSVKGLIVDNFAGGGGASTGIKLALGRDVDLAVNHSPQAIAMHTANHPTAKHFQEDVWKVDPVEALRRLARGHGLLVSDDGTVTDALEEVVRITRHYAKQLAVWDRDKTAEADRLSAEGDALREDNARLTRERDEARDALQVETQRLESLWAAVRELREALAASSVASAEMDHANRRELHGAITLEEYGAIGVAFERAVARADAADAAIRALTEAP